MRTVECVVVNHCYSHQPNSLKHTDSKLYFTKLLTVCVEVNVTSAKYYSHLFFSSENFLDLHSNHLISKSKETILWRLHLFAIHAHYDKETNSHIVIIMRLLPRIVPLDTRRTRSLIGRNTSREIERLRRIL